MMKLAGLLMATVLFSSLAGAINLNTLIKQKLQETVKKASPPPAPPAATTTAAPAPIDSPADLEKTIKTTWNSIPQATSTCDGGNTLISKNISDSSGRFLYCYLSSLISLDQLQKLAGLPVFASGPHKEKLDFSSRKTFGRYNEKFAKWVLDKVVPNLVDPSFKAAHQETFNGYLKPSLLKMQAALNYVFDDWERFGRIKRAYEEQLNSPNGVESAYKTIYLNMAGSSNPLSCSPESVGFWVRRSIDGTMATFRSSLGIILNAYAPEEIKTMEDSRRAAFAPAEVTDKEITDYLTSKGLSLNDKRFNKEDVRRYLSLRPKFKEQKRK
ncbi:MAG: hypothetical protein EB078_02750 [Proteobacteria bacterium]|nr:hypothetical protein [Pseudomonadota bacterium]